MRTPPTVRQAFGLRVAAAPAIPAAPAPAGSRRPLVRIGSGTADARAGEPEETVWTTVIDQQPVEVRRAPDGALAIVFGRQGTFHVSADASSIHAAARAGADPARWQRFLLDTVLWCTALQHGQVALHAAAVAGPGGAVGIAAGTGGGKTSLAAELVRRGAALLADDILVLTSERVLLAHPAPHVMNLDVRAPAALRRALGRPLATLDGECWLEVARGATAPTPLRAVFLLERTPGGSAAAIRTVDRPLIELTTHAVTLPGLPIAHARRRFEIVADIVATVPIWRLTAGAALPPARLADALEDALAQAAPVA